jgi:hypothetical protein
MTEEPTGLTQYQAAWNSVSSLQTPETDDLRAPRGALLYSPCSGQRLEEVSLDLMADP